MICFLDDRERCGSRSVSAMIPETSVSVVPVPHAPVVWTGLCGRLCDCVRSVKLKKTVDKCLTFNVVLAPGVR